MNDEQDEIDDEADSAAAAFEELRAEISVLRRAVEAIPATLRENRPPDYALNRAGFARNQRRSDHDAFVSGFAQLALNAITARTSLIAKSQAGSIARQLYRQRL